MNKEIGMQQVRESIYERLERCQIGWSGSPPFGIPCKTSARSQADVCLVSPTIKNPIIRFGSQLTIIDCFTHGLLFNRSRYDPMAHYLWLPEFLCKESLPEDGSVVVVAPDPEEILGVAQSDVIKNKWIEMCHFMPCLVVGGSTLFHYRHELNVVGHAIKPFTQVMDEWIHSEWTHSFSRNVTRFNRSRTRLWSFDSAEV